VDAWWAKFGREPAQTKDLVAVAVEVEAFGLTLARVTTDPGSLVTFGMKVLGRHKDTPVGEFVIRRIGNGNTAVWVLRDRAKDS